MHREEDRQIGRQTFAALLRLAEWDAGRTFYPGGSGAWRDGKWVKLQRPTAALEPIVSHCEARGDPQALIFARAVAEGLIADSALLPNDKSRIPASGKFRGHMHAMMHRLWGVAHLEAVLKELKLTILCRGNSVREMLPKGKGLPVDFSTLGGLPDLPE